jgi:exonuclease III
MNLLKNFKNKMKKLLFCFNFETVCEKNSIKYQPIFTIGDVNSDDIDTDDIDTDLHYWTI